MLVRIVLILNFFFFVLFLSGCGEQNSPSGGKKLQSNPPVVLYLTAEERSVQITQEWVGTLDGMINAEIRSQITGYIVQRNYEEGKNVNKGDLLYQIDPRKFEANLDAAKAKLTSDEAILKTAQLDLERIRLLLPEEAVSERDFDNATSRVASSKAQVESARANLHSAELELSLTQIRSPITGVAGISSAQIGNLVGPGSSNTAALTMVSQVDPIRAYLSLSEKDLLKFVNDPEHNPHPTLIELILADGSVYPEKGKLMFTDRSIDMSTGTIKVAILFPNPHHTLKPGQFVRIRALTHDIRGVLVVPQRSVMNIQDKHFLALIGSDDRVVYRQVNAGRKINNDWIIEAGLEAGEKVITEGHHLIHDGQTVIPKPDSSLPVTQE